jgi:hypothetical protein
MLTIEGLADDDKKDVLLDATGKKPHTRRKQQTCA